MTALLISLHLPKTAGTSFLAVLEQQYGDRLMRDYGDRPLNQSVRKRCMRALSQATLNGLRTSRYHDIDCIHGHFLPLKYRFLALRRPVRFVTWLRDPVERLASHYYYWQRTYNPIDSGRLHRRVVEERWDLERFCLSPELRNTYCRFLWGFPLARFDFLGITERFDSDLQELATRFFGTRLHATPQQNVNARRTLPASVGGGDSDHAVGEVALADRVARVADDGAQRVKGVARQAGAKLYVTDSDFRRAVAEYHAQDMALYEQVLRRRRDPATRVLEAGQP